MLRQCGYFLYLLFILLPHIKSAHRLSKYISHYETLDYDCTDVHREHLRAKRSLVNDNTVHLSFHAHGRDFQLRLKKDLTVFHENLEVHGSSGLLNVDTSHIYHGYVEDVPDSSVYGSIIDGVFEGKIVTPTGSYYVEKAHHYFPHKQYPNRTFHSVIYDENHVNDPNENHRKGHNGGCGITNEVIQWMDQIQNSAVEEDSYPITKPKIQNETLLEKEAKSLPPLYYEDYINKYSREANQEKYGRHKRAARRREQNKNTCSLYIQTDPLLWRHIREGFSEHADPRKQVEVDEKTREEILSLIAHHVTAVNYIYGNAKFDGRSEHRGIKFEVQRIKIDEYSSCRCTHPNCEINQFCKENIDVSNFLNIHSLENHEDFCLAYVFTYRDFTNGTLGLAWIASASGASGGICENYKTYTETIGETYQSTKRSLNTGVITLVNYKSRVPPKVSQLMLAHEIGHNFGSPHDYPLDCQPGGLNGNFIMFGSATSADRPNNSKFSGCSIRNISNVLDAIEDYRKRNCFTSSAGAFCGNKIVEAGEECDCGYDNDECMDRCCYPRIVDYMDRQKNISARGCQRKRDTQCSPSQGPCCSGDTCSFVPSYKQEICRIESDCSRSSKCNGFSAECPSSTPRSDKTTCNNDTQICINGDCTDSICIKWNLTSCFLTSQDHFNIDERKLCELACKNGTDICRSTREFAHLVGLPPGGISLTPGSPCNNFYGYCDDSLKCRAIDADGPLARLTNSIYN